MKNILPAVLMIVFISTSLFAQTTTPPAVKAKKTHPPAMEGMRPYVPKPKMEHGHKSGVINASAVPKEIKKSFADDVEKPTNVKWAKHDSTYEVWFTDWGFQKFRVYYNDTSSTVAEMAVKQLVKTIPANVKQYVATNYKDDNAPMVFYKGYAFRTDANVKQDLNKPYLRIDMADHTLYFDESGNFVKEAYIKQKVVM